MPIDQADLHGTEKDGSPSADYCKFCYKHGEFTNPSLSLEEMKEHMIAVMDNQKEKLPEDIIEAAIARLPGLKRWAKRGQYRISN